MTDERVESNDKKSKFVTPDELARLKRNSVFTIIPWGLRPETVQLLLVANEGADYIVDDIEEEEVDGGINIQFIHEGREFYKRPGGGLAGGKQEVARDYLSNGKGRLREGVFDADLRDEELPLAALAEVFEELGIFCDLTYHMGCVRHKDNRPTHGIHIFGCDRHSDGEPKIWIPTIDEAMRVLGGLVRYQTVAGREYLEKVLTHHRYRYTDGLHLRGDDLKKEIFPDDHLERGVFSFSWVPYSVIDPDIDEKGNFEDVHWEFPGKGPLPIYKSHRVRACLGLFHPDFGIFAPPPQKEEAE